MSRGQWTQGSGGGIDTDGLTATPDKVLAPYTFGGAGSDDVQTGIIETVKGMTIYPMEQDQVISAPKYFSGNITITAVTPPPAECLKKNYVYMGVTGSFEGYVAEPNDLYYKGINTLGFSSVRLPAAIFELDNITIPLSNSAVAIKSSRTVNLTGYKQIIIEGSITTGKSNDYGNPCIEVRFSSGSTGSRKLNSDTTYSTITIPINKSIVTTIEICTWTNQKYSSGPRGKIRRIRLV